MDMQVNYPKKHPQVYWDTVNTEYPVRLQDTSQPIVSSETIARRWRSIAEVSHKPTERKNLIKEFSRDYGICRELERSQTSVDFSTKIPETIRHNKHTSSAENKYIYPPSKSVEFRPPPHSAYGTTVMRESYTTPITVSRLNTDKDQFKHPAALKINPEFTETLPPKLLEQIDTTYDGYEKYLDPYLTTSRLHYRPYTADQLKKISNSKDIVTYYTLGDIPWVWSTKPKHDDFYLRVKGPKSMYDREKFKEDFREIRTHNKLQLLPGSFRTETRDNFSLGQQIFENNITDFEENVRSAYQRSIARLKTNVEYEDERHRRRYNTENSQIGSEKPICSVFEQCVKKNKRLLRTFFINK